MDRARQAWARARVACSARARVARRQGQRAWEKTLYVARLALGVVVVAIGGVATWLMLSAIGTWVVYADAPAEKQAPASHAAVDEAAANEAAVPRLTATYVFDDLPRTIDGSLSCPKVTLTEFTGDAVRLEPAARVVAPFREHLVELERVVRQVSQQFYGRAPSALLVAASYDCRPVTGNRARLSEHALGNAIDISAFRFEADAATGAPGFEVRVDRHWNAHGDESSERHARFLRAVTQALIARDVFRTLLGPAHPDHHDHFHFDMAPHHYVDL